MTLHKLSLTNVMLKKVSGCFQSLKVLSLCVHSVHNIITELCAPVQIVLSSKTFDVMGLDYP